MGSVNVGAVVFVCILCLASLIGFSQLQQIQPLICSLERNDCLGFNYCHNGTNGNNTCKPYGKVQLGQPCTHNVNCSGEFEYCGGKGENKTCTCLFGQDKNNGSCRLPVDGTKCKGREREEENPHRAPNEVEECQGKSYLNFRCHFYVRKCFCIAKHDEEVPIDASETRKKGVWFDPTRRKCVEVPKEESTCNPQEQDACGKSITKMACVGSKCTCPTGLTQYGESCGKTREGDMCQGNGVDYGTGTCPPGTQENLYCDEVQDRCTCTFLEGYLGEGVPEKIGSVWNATTGNCEFKQYEESCYIHKGKPLPGQKTDTCDDKKGLRCRQRSGEGKFQCLCHEGYGWNAKRGRCPLVPGQKCGHHSDCFLSKKCEAGVCACPAGQSGNWSMGLMKCVTCDDPAGDCPSVGSFSVFGDIVFLAQLVTLALFLNL